MKIVSREILRESFNASVEDKKITIDGVDFAVSSESMLFAYYEFYVMNGSMNGFTYTDDWKSGNFYKQIKKYQKPNWRPHLGKQTRALDAFWGLNNICVDLINVNVNGDANLGGVVIALIALGLIALSLAMVADSQVLTSFFHNMFKV